MTKLNIYEMIIVYILFFLFFNPIELTLLLTSLNAWQECEGRRAVCVYVHKCVCVCVFIHVSIDDSARRRND